MDNDTTALTQLIGTAAATRLRDISPSSFDVAERFWSVPAGEGPLTPRVRELLLLAMHANTTAVNVDAIGRHIQRALDAGATEGEVVDVLITLVALANHALYTTIPILEEELAATGNVEPDDADLDAAYQAAKADFIASRGFWNDSRDLLARLMPVYFTALNGISTETWKNGPLSTKEREFVCIAIDCTVTHSFEPGLRQHIRNALEAGATRAEIGQIFQLAALLGLEGYFQAGRYLAGTAED